MKKYLFLLANLIYSFTSYSETIEVTAQNYSYTPTNITVNVGDTVIWINNGGNHDVNGNISAITGEPYNNPESFYSDYNNVEGEIIYSHVFNVPGEYNYDCSVGNHALQGMVGTINVVYSSVFEIIEQSANHDTLEIAILEAELDGALSGDGTFTVFAPTDAAFALIDPAIFQAIISDNAILTPILLHHVHNEATVLSTSLFDGMMVPTMNNDELTITQVNESTFKVDDAIIILADLIADNGVVHVIDAVLTPPIPEEITVYDIIENSPDHNTLETALIEANLVDALSGEGPLTVFAPTDAAFDALPAGTLDNLLNDIPALTTLLTHHVHLGELDDTDLTDGLDILTLNNDNITVSNDGNTIMIDDATVSLTVTQADNGIIHIIDAVLTVEEPTSIYELERQQNKYLYTLNLLGEKVERNSSEKILIDVYSNGTIIKRYNSK